MRVRVLLEAPNRRYYLAMTEITELKAFSDEKRQKLADQGKAMKDGSFPIEGEADLKRAIQAHGRAKNPDAVKTHIIKQAKRLDAVHLLPAGWGVGDENDADEGTTADTDDGSAIAASARPSLTAAAREIARRVREELAGDLPGHPFRGNQYSDGGAGKSSFNEDAFNRVQDHAKSMRATVEAGGPHHVAGDMSNPRVVANANVGLAASRVGDAASSAAFGNHLAAATKLHEASRILDEAESQARRGGGIEDHAHGEGIRQLRGDVDSLVQHHLSEAHKAAQ